MGKAIDEFWTLEKQVRSVYHTCIAHIDSLVKTAQGNLKREKDDISQVTPQLEAALNVRYHLIRIGALLIEAVSHFPSAGDLIKVHKQYRQIGEKLRDIAGPLKTRTLSNLDAQAVSDLNSKLEELQTLIDTLVESLNQPTPTQ